jgi:hypothetical protein
MNESTKVQAVASEPEPVSEVRLQPPRAWLGSFPTRSSCVHQAVTFGGKPCPFCSGAVPFVPTSALLAR